jgi:pimeloyl-ACP methyl ester carboxylesterase
MFPEFLPKLTENLSETTSVALSKNIDRQPIQTPLISQPITTTFVRQGRGGIPILLLHGFDSSLLEYRRIFPLLATNNETIAVDLLGFGFTERMPGLKISPQTISSHLYCFWKTAINQPIILVGASMGGAAAIDFTLNYPEIVTKLILIDPAGATGGPPLGKYLFPPLGYLATSFLRSPKVRQKISENAYFDKSFASADALICAGLHLETKDWDKALISFTKSGGYRPFGKKLAEIRQPSLILWGEYDKILGTGDAVKFEKGLPNSQLIWIKNSGHVPHLEQPQITAEKILEFIAN